MEFDSPDVARDFPGLYASEAKKSNDSDFSDENHDKSFKKDSIIGKRKEKKDSKKDRGYATLEGESSQDEEVDSRSPCKSKKTKSFKFSTKRSEKREKSREKDFDKKDKEKKEKAKTKDKRKIKSGEELSESNEDFNIFGVGLSTAVERNGCLDGVPIPLVVRNCIDCIHNFGLSMDGLYKVLGMKSKVQSLRKMYNAREPVSMGENDVIVATCLLKMFLRELPEPILTNDLLTRFEEAGAVMETDCREKALQTLIAQLPYQNKVLLGWLILHFDTVTLHEKQNKLNAQSIAMTFSPVLQMSHRLLTAFLCHCKSLFPDIIIERYIPPLCPGSSFPESPDEMAIELKKQESLLNQIHREMSEGFVSKKKEELLWEVQRIVTQLKRKLKSLQRFQETSFAQRSLEDDQQLSEINSKKESIRKKSSEPENAESKMKLSSENFGKSKECSPVIQELKSSDTTPEDSNETDSPIKSSPEKCFSINEVPKLKDLNLRLLKTHLENEELLKFKSLLKSRIDQEKELIVKLSNKIQTYKKSTSLSLSPRKEPNIEKLEKEHVVLQNKIKDLINKIFEERLACISLKVYIGILEMPQQEC